MTDKLKPRLNLSNLSRRDFLGIATKVGIPTLAALLAACSPIGRKLIKTLTSPSPSLAPSLTPVPPSTPIPPSTATAEAPTATVKLVALSDSLGVNPEFGNKLKSEGIDSTINGEKGNWTVSKVVSAWKQDGTSTTEENV